MGRILRFRPRMVLGLSLLAATAVMLAACGGEDKTPAPKPAATQTSIPARTSPAPATFQVAIANVALPNVTVPVGTTVTWTNTDSVPHTVTSGKDGKFDGKGWNSDFLNPGQTFPRSFTQTGTFTYTCRVHTTLNATVTVTRSGPASATAGETGSGYTY